QRGRPAVAPATAWRPRCRASAPAAAPATAWRPRCSARRAAEDVPDEHGNTVNRTSQNKRDKWPLHPPTAGGKLTVGQPFRNPRTSDSLYLRGPPDVP